MPTLKLREIDVSRIVFGELIPYKGQSNGGYFALRYMDEDGNVVKGNVYVQFDGSTPIGISNWDGKFKLMVTDMSPEDVQKFREITDAFQAYVREKYPKEKWATKKDVTPTIKEPSSDDRAPNVNLKVTEWTKYRNPDEPPARGEEDPPLLSVEGMTPPDGENYGGALRGSSGTFVCQLSGWVVPATGYGIAPTCNMCRLPLMSQSRGPNFVDDDEVELGDDDADAFLE